MWKRSYVKEEELCEYSISFNNVKSNVKGAVSQNLLQFSR